MILGKVRRLVTFRQLSVGGFLVWAAIFPAFVACSGSTEAFEVRGDGPVLILDVSRLSEGTRLDRTAHVDVSVSSTPAISQSYYLDSGDFEYRVNIRPANEGDDLLMEGGADVELREGIGARLDSPRDLVWIEAHPTVVDVRAFVWVSSNDLVGDDLVAVAQDTPLVWSDAVPE